MKQAIVIASVLVLATGVVHADNKQKADTLFKQGKKLMGEKRYSDACESFEQSYKLDPVIGTQLNIAKCYEEWGKIGRAYLAYQAAEKQAKSTGDDREAKIHELVVALDSDVPRLTIKLPKDSPKGLTVTLDAKPVSTFGEPFVVDPGPHTIEYGLGGEKKQKIVPLERGGDSSVTLDIPESMRAKAKGDEEGEGDNVEKPVDPPIDETPPPDPGRGKRLGGIALGGAGLLAIGVSTVMTVSAKGKYNDAIEMHCGGMKTTCNQMGLDLTADARSSANIATFVFLAGTAAVAGGVALYLLAPDAPAEDSEEQARYLAPAVTPNAAALVFGGTF